MLYSFFIQIILKTRAYMLLKNERSRRPAVTNGS